MRLKKLTWAVKDELDEALKFLEGQTFQDVFESSTFPHINSSISGSVEFQSTPTWYTRIHDAIEHTLVEYSKDDIENEQFLEIKLALVHHSLEVDLYHPKDERPVILMSLAATVQDVDKGTFQFNTELVKIVQINRDLVDSKLVA